MASDDIMRLIYVGLLLAAVAGWFFAQNRLSLSKVLQQALVWMFIFLGLIAAYGLWEDIRRAVGPDSALVLEGERVEVPRSGDGHYHLRVAVNGVPVSFVVDTGATSVVLTRDDAARVGLDPDDLAFIGRANTANGTVRTAPVRLETMTLGDVTDRNVAASVNEGELFQSLLGMSYLNRWGRIEIESGRLVLTR
ncbi:MAG: TIGR02281 family clan AA aspartic protease [Marinibacterium sp.]|nr:TIGR02281 family clan AA aspartic protease [Marinibacterium sp.]